MLIAGARRTGRHAGRLAGRTAVAAGHGARHAATVGRRQGGRIVRIGVRRAAQVAGRFALLLLAQQDDTVGVGAVERRVGRVQHLAGN